VSHADAGPAQEKIAGLQLVPGHNTTAAEVWLWQGRFPEAHDRPRPWVVLRTDDWPMSAESARALAAALLRADRVETASSAAASGTGENCGESDTE
jgi:hypothetical protein